MHDLLPLINAENQGLQASAYVCLQYLCEHSDHDEVAYSMMNELICVDANFDGPLISLQNARFLAVVIELFGKSLERMTRARDWMLYITLIANFFVTHIEGMAQHLIQDASLGSSSPPSTWDSCCIIYSNSCLDFVHFIHSKTVAKDPSTFPVRRLLVACMHNANATCSSTRQTLEKRMAIRKDAILLISLPT